MYKNQLQELAQRSCFNLPCYTCIREGPDHAPRFKATVSFNGEVFESPGYHTTLRQAEHAAAEVALATLSQRGPTQSLAARILDETGVCKNLLQETAQRAGVSLPVYNTIRTGPKHQPLYKCIVEIGGRHFKGEPATTKKQAEKNAATAAWAALNQPPASSHEPLAFKRPESVESRELSTSRSMSSMDGRPSYQATSGHTQVVGRPRRYVSVRERSSTGTGQSTGSKQLYPMLAGETSNANRKNCSLFNQVPVIPSSQPSHELVPCFTGSKQYLGNPSLPVADINFDSLAYGQKIALHHNQAIANSPSQSQGGRHQRRHSLSGMESPMLSKEAVTTSRASAGGTMLARNLLHSQQQQIRGLPYQSLSERFELKRSSLLEELQLRDEEDDWLHQEQSFSSGHRQNLSSSLSHSHGNRLVRMPSHSESERFEGRMHHLSSLADVHGRDAKEWLCSDSQEAIAMRARAKTPDFMYGLTGGQLPNVSILNGDLQRNNQRDGRTRGDMLQPRGEDAAMGHGYREGWSRTAVPQQCSKGRDPPLKQDHGYGSKYTEGWPCKETLCCAVENDWAKCEDQLPNKALPGGENRHMAGSSATTSGASPLSSLWSKSSQWWGSRAPSSMSSAAASVVSTLGLRPPRSAAPSVKVRQMVPVCSAPPRRTDTPGWRYSPQSHEADYVSESCQALNNLRF